MYRVESTHRNIFLTYILININFLVGCIAENSPNDIFGKMGNETIGISQVPTIYICQAFGYCYSRAPVMKFWWEDNAEKLKQELYRRSVFTDLEWNSINERKFSKGDRIEVMLAILGEPIGIYEYTYIDPEYFINHQAELASKKPRGRYIEYIDDKIVIDKVYHKDIPLSSNNLVEWHFRTSEHHGPLKIAPCALYSLYTKQHRTKSQENILMS